MCTKAREARRHLWQLQGLLHAHGPAEQVLHGCQ